MNTLPLRNQRGIALVIVLVFLVLLSIFIVGFFSNSQDELTAAQSFTGEVSASHLAESAVSVVMGQIREATSRTNGAWGSQPGMIRVYRDGNNASDKADAFFKLYSSDHMIVSGNEIKSYDPSKEVAEGAKTGWQDLPAIWTNLNEEVKVPVPNSDSTVSRYPIIDPLCFTGAQPVEGFELKTVSNATPESASKLARMPVKWLYVLKDGTLTSPSSTGANGTQAIWKAGEREPTVANPIVGRVAFWTDDESCKVNINTAGGYTTKPEDTRDDGGMPTADEAGVAIGEDEYAGSFWDTPRAFTLFDRGAVLRGGDSRKGSNGGLERGGLALSQPVRGEYQRYPGHPSTTSLGIVFRGRPSNASISMQDAPYMLKSGQLALLAPRLMFSLTNRNERATNYGTDRLLATDYRSDETVEIESNDQPVNARVKRLYASVDELFFAQPDKSPGLERKQTDWEIGAIGSDGKKVNANDDTKVLTADYLEKMRFFLTAHSRAPEVNLYGQPRVSIWPVWEVSGARPEKDWWNPSDRLIAFCSTIGPDATKVQQHEVLRYIFQRLDAYSPTYDLEIKRNANILTYLRSIIKKPFPGVGGLSFEQKYRDTKFGGDGKGSEQILVQIFDYIRTVNLRDSTRDKKFNEDLKPIGGGPNVRKKELYKYAPRGLVIPARSGIGSNARNGFGRFPTISEASIVLYCSGYVGEDGKKYLNSRETTSTSNAADRGYGPRVVLDRAGNFVPAGATLTTGVKVKEVLVRAFLITETFNPMQGYAPTTTANGNSLEKGTIVYEIENLSDFKFGGKSLGFPTKVTNDVGFASGNLWGGRNSGGSEGFLHTMWAWPASRPKAGIAPGTAGLGGGPWYPFQSEPNDIATGIHGISIPYGERTAELVGPKSLTVKMYYSKDMDNPVRNMSLDFSTPVTIPVPTDEVWSTPYTGGDPALAGTYQARYGGGFIQDSSKDPLWACNGNIQIYNPGPTYTPRDRTAKSLGDWLDGGTIKPGRLTWIQNDSHNHMGDLKPSWNYDRRWQQILQPGDVVRSVVFGDAATGKGDLRVSCLAGVDNGAASAVFFPHPDYASPTVRHAQTLRMADAQLYYPDNNETKFGNIARLGGGRTYPAAQASDLPFGTNGVQRPDGSPNDRRPGDFDTGIGSLPDGPFANKADEGNLAFRQVYKNTDGSISHYLYPVPYFTWSYEETFDTFFSPNRQVPSPVVFGSLLSGRSAGWQTLCFSPNPAGANHPGQNAALGPKDYLWLDLFTMPVVEPYAISEPFSTAGKVNLNYPIIPFSHIKRTTALRAALQPLRVTALPVNDVLTFKTSLAKDPATGKDKNYRYLVDRDETIKGFDDFFSEYATDPNKGFIKAAAQICDFYLYPRREGKAVVNWGKGDTAIKQWWNSNALTGDNVREKPYGDLYPRITTKSNTFCVHVRAQSLRQSAASDPKEAAAHYRTWDEKRDRVVGEYRGASIIERYIDPQDERFDFSPSNPNKEVTLIKPDSQSIDPAYRFRVLNTKRFDP